MSKEFEYHPERTVPGRRGPSVVARFIGENGFAKQLGVRTILDYGCGKGIDIPYYRNLGLFAEGYDPFPSFGFSMEPYGVYDLVIIAFVLNVLPDTKKRIEVVDKASDYLKANGSMILVARSPNAIAKQVNNLGWQKHSDGYWSNKQRGMFQKGLSKQELTKLSTFSGMKVHPLDNLIKFDSYSSTLLLQKKI